MAQRKGCEPGEFLTSSAQQTPTVCGCEDTSRRDVFARDTYHKSPLRFSFAAVGDYVLRFTVEDGVCLPVFGEVALEVNAPPAVSINGADPVNTGTTHTYSADTDAANPSYLWSVTGGTINGSNTSSAVSVTAGAIGDLIVSVRVTDGNTTCATVPANT